MDLSKLPDEVAEKLTPAEEAFLNCLIPSIDEHEWITNAEVREATGKSEGSVKRFMRNLTGKGVLEARGETRNRQYRLCLRQRNPVPVLPASPLSGAGG